MYIFFGLVLSLGRDRYPAGAKADMSVTAGVTMRIVNCNQLLLHRPKIRNEFDMRKAMCMRDTAIPD